MPQRYVAPDWLTLNVFNPVVVVLTLLGNQRAAPAAVSRGPRVEPLHSDRSPVRFD